MCLILIALDSHPDYSLVVAANRDEFYDRPTAAAAFWPDRPGLLGGRDLKAGGTWLGIDRTGRFAAVTNYRQGEREPTAPGERLLSSAFVASKEYGTRSSTVVLVGRDGGVVLARRRGLPHHERRVRPPPRPAHRVHPALRRRAAVPVGLRGQRARVSAAAHSEVDRRLRATHGSRRKVVLPTLCRDVLRDARVLPRLRCTTGEHNAVTHRPPPADTHPSASSSPRSRTASPASERAMEHASAHLDDVRPGRYASSRFLNHSSSGHSRRKLVTQCHSSSPPRRRTPDATKDPHGSKGGRYGIRHS
jgi:transport and Golgi organization protein 2